MERMRYSKLGRTGLTVSAVGFGCGSTAALFTDRSADDQYLAAKAAVDGGVNFFDTAYRYAAGKSEEALGATLRRLRPPDVLVATKLRVDRDDFADVGASVRGQVIGSLKRLGREHLDLIQLHNTVSVGEVTEPEYYGPLSVDDLFQRGVVAALEDLRREGLVRAIGFSGIGEPAAVVKILEAGAFDTVQVYVNLLNPSAAMRVPPGFRYIDYARVIDLATARGTGVIAIRVLAGGALSESELRAPGTGSWGRRAWGELVGDHDRAEKLLALRRPGEDLSQAAIRFTLAQPRIDAALVGFWSATDVAAALAVEAAGPSFTDDELCLLRSTLEIS
jgi:aryl-alcohol dehydrogenase-like predicted oxidoreductase